jgi:hypothetical protein
MPRFTVEGFRFTADQVVDGIPVNPRLPKDFDNTPNEERLDFPWWFKPFITTYSWGEIETSTKARTDEYAAGQIANLPEDRQKWFEAWPNGVHYETRCLDGGAWDRSTGWGMFATLQEAVDCAFSRDPHRYGKR